MLQSNIQTKVTRVERFADDLDLAQFRSDQLTELAIAARRIHQSTHAGWEYCLECGSKIPELRLHHVPSALRCRPCQEEHEAFSRYTRAN